MSVADTIVTGGERGQPFPFTAARQQEHADRRFMHQPGRCPACLRLHRAIGGNHEPHGGRPLRATTGDGCGQETFVSFAPRHGNAISCPASVHR